MKRDQKNKGPSASLTPLKIGLIVNALMAKISPKKIAFENNVSRDDIYVIRKAYSLFCGWTNEYGNE